MIHCGLQCLDCYYPIHLDTYSGCSHACKYCFANEKNTIKNIKPLSNAKALKAFIKGERNLETKWCDWDIPIHWGANSDPFQICEKEYKKSLECLEIFKLTKYPFIVSTKNPVLLTEEPYLSTMAECNCVLQISMSCPKYDNLEMGAPTFNERLLAAETLSAKVKRIIARIQPCFPDCKDDIIKALPKMKRAGIYGVIVSGYFTKKKTKGMLREGTRYRFPLDVLYRTFKPIKDKCHEVGLKFLCGEGGLDWMGDSLICCGTSGLDDFKPNLFTLSNIAYDPENSNPTEKQKEIGTTRPFRSIRQSQAWELHIKDKSYADMLYEYYGYVEWLRDMRDKYGSD